MIAWEYGSPFGPVEIGLFRGRNPNATRVLRSGVALFSQNPWDRPGFSVWKAGTATGLAAGCRLCGSVAKRRHRFIPDPGIELKWKKTVVRALIEEAGTWQRLFICPEAAVIRCRREKITPKNRQGSHWATLRRYSHDQHDRQALLSVAEL